MKIYGHVPRILAYSRCARYAGHVSGFSSSRVHTSSTCVTRSIFPLCQGRRCPPSKLAAFWNAITLTLELPFFSTDKKTAKWFLLISQGVTTQTMTTLRRVARLARKRERVHGHARIDHSRRYSNLLNAPHIPRRMFLSARPAILCGFSARVDAEADLEYCLSFSQKAT